MGNIQHRSSKIRTRICMEIVFSWNNFDPYCTSWNFMGGTLPLRNVKEFGWTANKIWA
jgi:hypothetical protein